MHFSSTPCLIWPAAQFDFELNLNLLRQWSANESIKARAPLLLPWLYGTLKTTASVPAILGALRIP